MKGGGISLVNNVYTCGSQGLGIPYFNIHMNQKSSEQKQLLKYYLNMIWNKPFLKYIFRCYYYFSLFETAVMEGHMRARAPLTSDLCFQFQGISYGKKHYKSLKVQHRFSSVDLILSLYLCLFPTKTDTFSFSYSIINFYQHSRFRHLEITFSCSRPPSLSLSVSPNTHHISVDSQLAQSFWTVTVLGRNSGFPKIHLIDYFSSFLFSP